MDLFHAIEKRHSYRGNFTDAPVPREDLERIVDAGIRAPSGHNAQTTSFVIVDNQELLAEVTGCLKPAAYLQSARAAIVVLMDPRPASGWDVSFGVQDYAAAVENMLLATTALGYASVWLDGDVAVADTAQKIARVLSVPEPLQVRVVLPLGVPQAQRSQRQKKPFDERAHWNGYGGRA